MQYLLSQFGSSKNRVEMAICALQAKKGVILIDDKNRENEGDLVFVPENMTIKQMAFTIRHGSGIVCLCIREQKRRELNLPIMVKNNTSTYNTQFTVSIEAATGITTGVSARDRLETIKQAIKDTAKPSHLSTPGHIFPICADNGGIFSRSGHTEASITLMILAGFKPISIISELTKRNGEMAKINDIIKFSKIHHMTVLQINDIIEYLKSN